MADIGDIRPLLPTYPKRPTDRVEKDREQNEKNRHQPPSREKIDSEDDDGKPHVDEFA